MSQEENVAKLKWSVRPRVGAF